MKLFDVINWFQLWLHFVRHVGGTNANFDGFFRNQGIEMPRRWYRGQQSRCQRTPIAIGFGNDAASNSQLRLRHNGCNNFVLAFGKGTSEVAMGCEIEAWHPKNSGSLYCVSKETWGVAGTGCGISSFRGYGVTAVANFDCYPGYFMAHSTTVTQLCFSRQIANFGCHSERRAALV